MRAAALLPALLALSCARGTPSAPAPPFRLGGPEVMKLDWGTRALTARDLDGDGKADLAVLNNDRARIDLLYQKRPGEAAQAPDPSGRWEPVLEDARFRKASITTGISMFALAAGDLNGDGLADLAYTGKPDGLTVRLQGKGGDWSAKRVYDIQGPASWSTSLKAADLDGDSRTDLAVLAEKELLLFFQDAKGSLSGPERYPLSEEGCYGLDACDLDADSRTDLLYVAPNRRDALRVRFQRAPRVLGPERVFRTEALRGGLAPLRTGAGWALAGIQAQTGTLALSSLSAEESPALSSLKPRVFPIRAGSRIAASYALGDLDGDRRTDLAVGDAEGAQVLLYLQQAGGELSEPLRFPSLSELKSVAAADLDGDGKAELLSVSPKERTLGISRLVEGRLGYPQPVPLEGKPLAVAAGDLDADGAAEAVCAVEDGGKRCVAVLRLDPKSGAWTQAHRLELAGLKTDPKAVRILDADQDGRQDLAVFASQEPMRLLRQKPDGGFAEASAEPGFRKGLVDNLDPSALSTGDPDGDGKSEILVGGAGFARALRLDAAGVLQVADQFNARESDAEVTAALAADLDGDGAAEVLLLDRKGEGIQVLRRDERKVFRFSELLPVGRIDLVGAEAVDLDANGRVDLLLLGKDRFWWIPTGRRDLALSSLATYESDRKDADYQDLAAGDLNGDGREDLVLVDGSEDHILDILDRTDGGAWRRALHFTVFETDAHYAGRKGNAVEPRESVVADLTGDGKADLALLIHDRLLLYPQE